jgi:hypothetical protein
VSDRLRPIPTVNRRPADSREFAGRFVCSRQVVSLREADGEARESKENGLRALALENGNLSAIGASHES